jgi:hypothetical protein
VVENINSSRNRLFDPQARAWPAPDHVHTLKQYIEEMDNYAANHQEEENETLREHWAVFKDTMPSEALDWFAPLETLSSMRERQKRLDGHGSIGAANVLETTEQELQEIWESKDPLLDHLGVVVLRKSLPSPEKSAAVVQEALSTAYPGAQAELQNYADGGGVVYEAMDQVMQQFRARQHNPNLRKLQQKTPRNMLSIASEVAADVNSPEALKTMRCTLLPILCQRLRAEVRATHNLAIAGKRKAEPDWLVDLESCLRFALLAERGALTLTHLDILNGTWATCLTGAKFWCLYQGEWDQETRSAFASEGLWWTPEKGTVRGVYLGPGDTLIMRPGFLIGHSVLTLDDCIMAGGMMWSMDDIGKIMGNLEYIMGHANVTNEHIPRQFPAVLETLLDLATAASRPNSPCSDADIRAMRSLRGKLKPILSCQCGGGCHEKDCKCLNLSEQERNLREPGCTTWCHSSIADLNDPLRVCARLPHAKTKTCTCKNRKCESRCPCRKPPREYCSPYCHPGVQCENCEEQELREKIKKLELKLAEATGFG